MGENVSDFSMVGDATNLPRKTFLFAVFGATLRYK
jgi:hypothetical protein